jgi:hypothetical protein
MDDKDYHEILAALADELCSKALSKEKSFT